MIVINPVINVSNRTSDLLYSAEVALNNKLAHSPLKTFDWSMRISQASHWSKEGEFGSQNLLPERNFDKKRGGTITMRAREAEN